jgi:hypothetical protein
VRPLGEVAYRLPGRAVALAETRRAPAVVFLASFALWWLESLVIPLVPGRDLGTYLGAYVQLFQSDPIDVGYVLGRTPISSLFVGGLLDLAGGVFAEPVMAALYAGSITAWFLAARSFGRRAAVLTAAVLVCWPGYAILFHELASDALFAAAFAGWSLLLVRVLLSPTIGRMALAGAGVGVLGLVRPANQVLIALAGVTLVARMPWRARILSGAAFVASAAVLLGAWAVHNGIRYGDYSVARGGNATVPFFRAFVTDKIVRPDNGPDSRELARAVQQRLLPREPYRSYQITLDEFFTDASPRMEVDLLALSDRLRGWDTDYSWLRDVGMEAVRAHPGRYARGVAGTMWGLLTNGLFRPIASEGEASSSGGEPGKEREGREQTGPTVVIGGRTLPKPSEGEPIPAAHEGGITTPDGSIYTVWTSPSEHHLVFVHPGDQARYEELNRRRTELAGSFPDRRGSATLTHRLNQSSRWYPPPILWLVVGVAALAIRRPVGALALATPVVAALIVIVLSALGLPAEPHYTVPVAPAFVLLAAAALLGDARWKAGPASGLGSTAPERV